MKNSVLVFCVLCASAALAQAGPALSTLSAEPSIPSFFSHQQTATAQPLAQSKSLLGTSTYTHAQGERPLWEVAEETVPVPLGDSARLLREEHAQRKKAKIIWQN